MCIRDRRKAALYVADRKVLFYLIEGERFIISPLDKQEKPKEEGGLDRTLSLIDAFLSSLPEDSAAVELPMDVTADYTSFLLHEEEHPSDDGIPRMKGQSLIDDFIEKSAEEPLLPQLGIKAVSYTHLGRYCHGDYAGCCGCGFSFGYLFFYERIQEWNGCPYFKIITIYSFY